MRLVKAFLKAGEDLVYPQGIRCHICGEDLDVDERGPHCKTCSMTIHQVSGALCHHCGKPFETSENAYIPYGLKCKACQEQFSYIRMHRSYGHYEEGLKKILMDLKYKERTDHVTFMGEALASVVSDTPDFQNIDYVVPVPIHFTRRLTRGYNQSDLLAKELSKRMADTASLDALVRQKRTVKLKKLDKEARKNALHNAIILNKHMAEAIKDKNLLLVDDIYTTGTTLEACAKVLYESSCASVYAVTLAMGY